MWPAFSQPEVIINLWLSVILMKMKAERKELREIMCREIEFHLFGGHLFSFLFFSFFFLCSFLLLKEKTLMQNVHIKISPRLCNFIHTCIALTMARDWTHWLAQLLADMVKDGFFFTFFRITTFQRQHCKIIILCHQAARSN